MRSLALNCLCVLLSLAAALAVCEAGLRLFHPRYHHIAEAHQHPDEQRIWKPPSDSHYHRPHPDTGRLHLVIRNNLGAREHRNFDQESLNGAVNVAFFGDSFTENQRVPVQYSFHTVLDFLLNESPQPGSARGEPLAGKSPQPGSARGEPLAGKSPQPGSARGEPLAGKSPQPGSARGESPSVTAAPARFNVLNFGVDAYGTGQAYLQYRSLPLEVKAAVKHVVHIFCSNDVFNLRTNRIFSLDDAGQLVESIPERTPLWIRALARAHLTYAVMDGAERLRREWRERFPVEGDEGWTGTPGGRPSVRLWRAVVQRWQAEVESAGANFTVVGLPRDYPFARRALASLPESVETFSLRDCFHNAVGDPPPTHMLRFENDSHWNEAANMVAAHCLHRFLEKRIGLSPAADEALARRRHVYYRAFAEAPDWEGGRWMPEPPWALPGAFSPSAGRAIVEKYLALEGSRAQMAEHWRRVVERAKAGGVLARAAWDVYAAWDERLFVYVKSPCRDEDLRPSFFLRVWPQAWLAQPNPLEWRGLLDSSQTHENADYVDASRFLLIRRTDEECVAGAYLPNVAFSMARTGQVVRPVTEGGPMRFETIWSVDLPLREYAD